MLRLRAGWLIPQHILALTHFVSEVTAEDFTEITQATEKALTHVDSDFHLIIDNRVIDNTNLATLETMLQFMPQLNHPNLRWIVMILPEKLNLPAERIEKQYHDQISLTHADTLEGAFQFLASVDKTIAWHKKDACFFQKE